MNRWKKPKNNICRCINCGNNISVSPETVKEMTFYKGELIATYVECFVCGEKMLKQLDTKLTRKKAEIGVKLELKQREGKKLNDKQKKRLQSIEKELYRVRSKLKDLYWDKIYQSLNQDDDEKTEKADQELTLGEQVTSTEEAGERMNEHEISE